MRGVAAGGVAERAGLCVGDRVVQVDGVMLDEQVHVHTTACACTHHCMCRRTPLHVHVHTTCVCMCRPLLANLPRWCPRLRPAPSMCWYAP